MRIPSHSVKHFHFVGIGGIGMSGIAEILVNLGYIITGSDVSLNANTLRLQEMGIPVHIGHHKDCIGNAQVLVTSTAIQPDNPEVLAARSLKIPVIPRAEMLAELMRLKFSIAISGTHGKTTTTSLASALLDTAGFDPTVVNGGIINSYGTNARLGKGDWIVVEADESDGSFLKLPATLAVVTNIDPEHMDFYPDFESIKNAFRTFVEKLPFYGLGILAIDHPVVQELASTITDRRLVTYGFCQEADIRAVFLRETMEGTFFDVEIRGKDPSSVFIRKESEKGKKKIKDIFLPMMGRHNVQNALSVIAMAQELEIEDSLVKKAFQTFQGVKRRFTKTGEIHGVTIIDDYAHHPVEISTVLSSAHQACKGRVIAVVQPHRYSRLHYLFHDFIHCFDLADQVFITPTYAAGESPIPGVCSESLVKGIQENGKTQAHFLENMDDLAPLLSSFVKEGDMILCLGAGDITHKAHILPQELAPLLFQQKKDVA